MSTLTAPLEVGKNLDLIARVERATGPDREIDALICERFDLPKCELPDCYPDIMLRIINRVKAGGEDGCIPRYTESLDAVVGLIERELPGWAWNVERFPRVRAQIAEPIMTKFGPGIGVRAEATDTATPALALLLAFLRAHEAQSGKVGK